MGSSCLAAGALLVSFWLGSASRAAAEPLPECDRAPIMAAFNMIWKESDEGVRQETCMVGRRPMMLTPETCRRALEARRYFDKLAEAAGFRLDELNFKIEEGARAEVYNEYLRIIEPLAFLRVVSMTTGFLNAFGLDREVLIYALSHELAHLVLARRTPLLSIRYGSKQVEASADLLGAQIAVRAGYSPEILQAGMKRVFACSPIINFSPLDVDEHPVESVRRLNLSAARERIEKTSRDVARQLLAEAAQEFGGQTPWQAYREQERAPIPVHPNERSRAHWIYTPDRFNLDGSLRQRQKK